MRPSTALGSSTGFDFRVGVLHAAWADTASRQDASPNETHFEITRSTDGRCDGGR